jgi:hypothetical protein
MKTRAGIFLATAYFLLLGVATLPLVAEASLLSFLGLGTNARAEEAGPTHNSQTIPLSEAHVGLSKELTLAAVSDSATVLSTNDGMAIVSETGPLGTISDVEDMPVVGEMNIYTVRSARQDFIPLAQGIDAILAHWGGEHDALAQLNNHIIDNVDALLYEGTTFYRKPKIPRPHNGFTTVPLIWERADQLSYRASTSMSGYQHLSEPVKRDVAITADTISISWPQGMDVRFSYDEATRTYLRWRGGTPELDATTGEQARASVVITMTTTATFLRDQYISVKTVGSGVARIAQGGVTISALWNKRNATDMLTFTDSKGAPIPLEPGTIWVLINAPLPAVTQ